MNVSLVMRNLVTVKDFFPGHVIVNGAEFSIWKFGSVVWSCLKPHLEVSFQDSNVKAFPADDLDGFFHEVDFQCFQL